MRLRFFVAAAALLSASLAAHASDIIYNINESAGGATAIGTIETDGVTGTVNTSDILDFTLTVSNGSASDTFGEADGNVLDTGDLSATSSGLYFDFSSTAAEGLVLGDAYYDNVLCFADQSATCFGPVGNIGIRVDDNDYQDTTVGGGVEEIATATSVTPEPSSFVLLGTRLIGVLRVTRRRLVG